MSAEFQTDMDKIVDHLQSADTILRKHESMMSVDEKTPCYSLVTQLEFIVEQVRQMKDREAKR